MSTLTETALDVALQASKRGVVELAGNWYACGLRHATHAEASETFDRFAEMERAARDKNDNARRPHIGAACKQGMIYATHIVDGELTADVVKLHYSKPTRSTYERRAPIDRVEVLYDETVTSCQPGPVDTVVRELARYIGYRKQRSIDSHERELFDIVRALAGRNGLLTQNHWVGQPRGDATTAPVGTMSAESVRITTGMWVHSERDTWREPDTSIDGGLAIAFDESQRVYACVGGHGQGGSELVPRLLPERAIHLCATGVCPLCPVVVRNEPRRMFRSCMFWLGRGSGPLTVADYRLLNVATTCLAVVL